MGSALHRTRRIGRHHWRSGGGKSILLKLLIGLITPDEGEVRIAGQNIARMNERELLKVRRRFGMLFQSAALFDSLTVAENIAFVLRRERALAEHEIAERVAEALEMVELPGTQQKKPAELSGGMRKRVGLARPSFTAGDRAYAMSRPPDSIP